MEIIVALKKLGEELSADEKHILETSDDAMAMFDTADKAIGTDLFLFCAGACLQVDLRVYTCGFCLLFPQMNPSWVWRAAASKRPKSKHFRVRALTMQPFCVLVYIYLCTEDVMCEKAPQKFKQENSARPFSRGR